jgi:pimeloyl-ACP methyl ester carboxylesterase
MTSTTDHFVEAPDGRLFARAWFPAGSTQGSPIVLIHDSLGSVDLWRDFPAQLCARTNRQVVAYDRLGFGRSDVRTDRLAPAFVRQEAEIYIPCLLQHFRMERFVAFGHSVGGAMAICCGAVLPQLTSAIVTESAQMFAEDQTLREIAVAKVAYARSERFEKLKKYHGGKTSWVLHSWTDTWLSPEFATWSVRDELRGVRCPLLAVHGDQDEFGSLLHLELARKFGGALVTTRVLQGLGHVPHKEQPETVLELLAGFLATAD